LEKKTASAIMLTLLLIGMLTLAFNVQPVRASGTIYIRADGSIDPPTANITSVDNVTYYFTESNYDPIVVERSNIVIDGAGYTLQSSGSGKGFYLSGINNVTIRNTNIKNFTSGICLDSSSNSSISGNNITANNWFGICLDSSSNSSISGNNITANNFFGIYLASSSSNSISGNNISGNNITNSWWGIYLASSSNHNSISGNTFTNLGLYVSDSYQNSVENNTVNGRPLVYLEGVANYSVGDAGQVILVRCDSIRVEGLNLYSTPVGVELWETSNSTISGNNITANNGFGICLDSSSSNSISGNNITNNWLGICLASSSSNSISGNNITANNYDGIDLDSSSSNSISGNSISGNRLTNRQDGIGLHYSSNYNSISGNNVTNNIYGINLGSDSLSNRLYHNNLIDNAQQVYFYATGYANVWDDGYPSGGNYWSDYTDRYPGAEELDGSGIWDTPYFIDTNNQDNYPLVNPWTPTPVKKPVVVLMHGFQSGEYDPDDIWSDMKNSLSDSCTVYVSHYAYDTETALSIKEYAGNLQREIEQIMQKEGVDKVDIVAHSMGGLVARWYIEMGNGDKHVRKLIMLETPNQGCNKVLLPLALAGVDPRVDELLNGLKFATAGMPLPPEAKWAFFLGSLSIQYSSYLGTALGMWMYWDPVKEMSSNSKFLKTLSNNYALNFKNKVDYTSLGGWLYEIPWLKTFDLDGVTKETVTLDPIAGFHKNLPKNPEIIQRIKQILQSDALNFAEMRALENNVENDTETQWTFPILGEIFQGEERSHEIPIGSATAANFMLAWSEGDLNLTLTTPNGTLIDPSFAENCSEVSYYGSENLTIKGYIIANPEIGVWNASVTAVDISEDQNYTIVAMLDTNVTLSIPISKYQYDLGESVNITAVLSCGNEATVNASVVGKIQRPDSMKEDITLFDDGLHGDNLANDGIYANAYTNSTMWGFYEITVTANGSVDNIRFARESFTAVWVEQYPDLTLNGSNICISEEIPLDGETIIISATINNRGQAGAINASILFYDGSPTEGTFIEEAVINVTASGVETASVQWNATYGAHEIYVLISPYNQFLEENYTNNMAFKSIYIFRHDVAVQDLSLYKTIIGESFSVNITALIKNQGDFAEPFNVTVYANTTPIATQTITLTSGNSTTVTFTWNTCGFAKGNYTISAFAEPVLGETDTADNTYPDGWVKVTVAGDINGDGIVNAGDLGLLGAAWFSNPNSPNWNPNADITGDEVVNAGDLGIIGVNWFKT